jgi:uncharacterized protein (DUF3084 family)
VHVQDLTQALASSESQKEQLLMEAQEARKGQANAVHYSELAQIELRNAKHELGSTQARLQNMQQQYTKQVTEIMNMRSEADALATKAAAELKCLKAERESLQSRMRSVPCAPFSFKIKLGCATQQALSTMTGMLTSTPA